VGGYLSRIPYGQRQDQRLLPLLSSDFNLAKFRANLADSSQSPFGFNLDLHELVYTSEFRERVIHYDAVWWPILQQAVNEGNKKLIFKVRNKLRARLLFGLCAGGELERGEN
jgi:hypothetical protein